MRSGTIFPKGFLIGSDQTRLYRKLFRLCHDEFEQLVEKFKVGLRIKYHKSTPRILSDILKNQSVQRYQRHT